MKSFKVIMLFTLTLEISKAQWYNSKKAMR